MTDAVAPAGAASSAADQTAAMAAAEDAGPVFVTGPGLLAAAAILGAGVWWQASGVVILAALVLALGLVGRTWSRVALSGIGLERSLGRTRAFPGDTLAFEVTVRNDKRLPLAELRTSMRIAKALLPEGVVEPVLEFAAPLLWHEEATRRFALHCRRRGYFAIQPAVIAAGDVFGLFEAKRTVRQKPLHVTVYPRLIALEELGLASLNPLGDARDPTRPFEDANRPDGIRDYTPETPFKAIAWGASARLGRLQAKTFDTTATLRIALVLDAESFGGEGDDFEFAISATASLAHRLIETRQAVGLAVNGSQADGGGAVVLDAARGADQERAMLDVLAKLRGTASIGLGALIELAIAGLAGRTTVVVVARALAGDALARLLELQRRGHAVTLLIVGDAPVPNTTLALTRLVPERRA